MARVVTLCTGNAARSVMAGAMLAKAASPEETLVVTTAGTHVVEGQPMSRRTWEALAAVGYRADGHRSRQVTAEDLDAADVVIAMAGEHVSYVRRIHPEAASKTATLRRLCRDLPSGPEPLGQRVAALALEDVTVEPWEDVDDPAGGEEAEYGACARDLAGLVTELAPRLL